MTLPETLIRALADHRLLIVWGVVPFPLRDRDPTTPATIVSQWSIQAAELPAPSVALHELPPVPILSLDPTARIERQFDAAQVTLCVVKTQDDVPSLYVHTLLKLAGDVRSRTGVVVSRERIRRLHSDENKRYVLDEVQNIVRGGALLLVGCVPASADFKAWWSLITANFTEVVPCYAIGAGPQGVTVLKHSFAEVQAELLAAYQPPRRRMETGDTSSGSAFEAKKSVTEPTRSGGVTINVEGDLIMHGDVIGRDRIESSVEETTSGEPEAKAPPLPPLEAAAQALPESLPPPLKVETLRVDAAVPERVTVHRSFDLAVAVRQASSPVLQEKDLPHVESGEVQIVKPESAPFVRLRVEVEAPECEIAGKSSRSFQLFSGKDSPVIRFHLTPRQTGPLSIFVAVYQEDDWLGSARVLTQAVDQPVGEVKFKIVSAAPESPAEAWLDMELRLRDRQNDHYPLEIELADGAFNRGNVPADIARWIATGDSRADGQALFDALFEDKNLREAWGEARGKSKRRRLRLWIDPPALHQLPWELLRDDEEIIAADADTPFSRYLPIGKEWGGPLAARPLRVLAAISIPADFETKDRLPAAEELRQEQQTLQAAFAVASGGLAELTILQPPITLARLEDELQRGYHMLHFVGHGAFNAGTGQAALYFQTDTGRSALVKDEEFAALLDRLNLPPKLVMLMACRSAQRATRDAFIGLGPQLVKIGLPAVVAMQDDISVPSARRFGEKFYRRLLEHGIVDLAMNEARSALITGRRYDAAVPVLFMRLRQGRLWGEATQSVTPIETSVPARGVTRSGGALSPEEIESLQRQLKEERENLRLIEEHKAKYVLSTDVPLQLLKEERHKRELIEELERKLGLRR